MNKYILFLFLVLFCQQNGYAQISELQPFMSGEAEPEMFFMDPVYNEKGEIMYYSYGGILKVQYEYNEDGSPKRKMAYIIDRHDCDWTILAVTNFSYKDGRLQQEQTRHHFSYESPLFITTKTIFYDPYSHTDTIKNSMEKITRHRVPELPSDDIVTTTVRYLNKYNQPDSIITTERYKRGDILGREDSDERTDLHRMVKVHYGYDSKKRLKSGHAFFQSGFDTIWHDSYTFKVDYHKNKTEWIQISKGIDIEAYREYGHVEEIETILKYIITTDSKNRVLSKLLTANEDIILSSKYSYDSAGKQTADIKLNMRSKYIESLGMSNLLMKGFGRDIEGIDYTVHSKDNCTHTEFHLKMEAKEEKKLDLTICSNGEDGLLSSVDFVRYDDGEIDDKRHSTFQHSADGLIERIEYYVYYEDEKPSLEPRHKVLYKRDAEGRIVYEETSRYDSEDKKWNPQNKEVTVYDDLGNIVLVEEYDYDSGSSFNPYIGWVGINWKSNKYDSNSNLIESLSKTWNEGKWENKSLDRYLYTSKGKQSLKESYYWGKDSNNWEGYSRDSLAYDDRGEKKLEISYEWLRETKGWCPKKKEEIEKEIFEERTSDIEYKKKITHYIWKNNGWQPDHQYVDNRGPSGSYLDMKLRWDSELKKWWILRKDSKSVDGQFLDFERYNWSYSDEQLEGLENFTKISLSEQGNDSQTIYRVWDKQNKIWQDTITCFELYDGIYSDKSYVYQQYDKVSNKWEYTRKVESKSLENTSLLQQYIWDSNIGDWQPDSKTIYYYYKDKYSNSYKSELYFYNVKTKEWQAQYAQENIDLEGKYNRRYTSYSYWDVSKKRWVKNVAVDKSSYHYDYYRWNEATNKWVGQPEEEFDKIEEFVSEVDKSYDRININTRF